MFQYIINVCTLELCISFFYNSVCLFVGHKQTNNIGIRFNISIKLCLCLLWKLIYSFL